MKQFVVLAALFACCAARAQTEPAAVTDLQIDLYKSGVEAGCRNRGREVGDPPAQVDAFCSCMIRTLNAEVSKIEWQRAIAHSLDKREQEEFAVFAPHMPRLAGCKPKPPA